MDDALRAREGNARFVAAVSPIADKIKAEGLAPAMGLKELRKADEKRREARVPLGCSGPIGPAGAGKIAALFVALVLSTQLALEKSDGDRCLCLPSSPENPKYARSTCPRFETRSLFTASSGVIR